MKQLVWLASFPKSGNTWVRAFLTAYQNGLGADLDINRLDASLHAASRLDFDRIVGFPASDLTDAEIDRLRPAVYRSLNDEATMPMFMKVHDVWRRNDSGVALFPAEATRLVVYIVRNPLAVASSYAHHYGLPLDQAITRMADHDLAIATTRRKLDLQLHQPMGGWSDHVAAWLTQDELPVHTLRYEDLCADPLGEFSSLLNAIGLPPDAARLAWALEQSRFTRLQSAEAESGFKERPGKAASRFFRQGRADAWREELNSEQIERITSRHGDWMRRLGYTECLTPEERMK